MRPASNMKIITGAAALAELGRDYRFKTEFYVNGEVSEGVLNGDLYIKGYGDPMIKEATLKQTLKAIQLHAHLHHSRRIKIFASYTLG